jgi:hypothetical protein
VAVRERLNRPAAAGSALVAQGIEHRSPKAGVAGSNPAGGTTVDLPFVPPAQHIDRGGNDQGNEGSYSRTMATHKRRTQGHIEERPNGSFRVIVYAGRTR